MAGAASTEGDGSIISTDVPSSFRALAHDCKSSIIVVMQPSISSAAITSAIRRVTLILPLLLSFCFNSYLRFHVSKVLSLLSISHI